MRRSELTGSLYDLVTGDEDARVCKDIPDAACNDQPENFFLQLGANVCTKIGDELASAKPVLPWLLSAAGAPAFFIGLLVPVRESLSLLPQLFVAAMPAATPSQACRFSCRTPPSAASSSRALLVSTALLVPFYAALAREQSDGGIGSLGALLVAAGIASSVSSGFWGRMADRSSRDVLRFAATGAGVLSVAVAAWTVAGSPGLPGGVFGWVADWVGAAETIGVLGLICLAGALGASRLDEVTQ